MIAITKVLFEAPINTNVAVAQDGSMKIFDPRRTGNVHTIPAAYAKNINTPVHVVNPNLAPATQQAAPVAAQQVIPVAQAPAQQVIPVAQAPAQQAVPVPTVNVSRGARIAKQQLSPEYRENLRQTFNSFPNRGRDLAIAGVGQTRPVNPADQAAFDARYRQIVANRTAGIPAAAPPPAVPPVATQNPPPPPVVPPATQPHVEPVQALPQHVVKTANTQDISGSEAAGIALKKGAKATGEALGGAAKKAMEFAGDHPTAAGLIAGVTGALGIRKLLQRNKQN